ncbi:MAG TPA: hypothetical protein VE913_12115, partial [Longimicrobium sp.]|nr:hypothetical protein [Longimicrobium sp.]
MITKNTAVAPPLRAPRIPISGGCAGPPRPQRGRTFLLDIPMVLGTHAYMVHLLDQRRFADAEAHLRQR